MTTTRTQLLTGLIVALVAVIGAPQVWAALRGGDVGVETAFFPVLGAAFGYLAVSRR